MTQQQDDWHTLPHYQLAVTGEQLRDLLAALQGAQYDDYCTREDAELYQALWNVLDDLATKQEQEDPHP